MLRIHIQTLLDELLTFNKDMSETEVNALIIPMLEEIVEVFGKDDADDLLWDVISRYEIFFNSNINVESICRFVYDGIKSHRSKNRYDKRLRMKINSDFVRKGNGFIIVLMDLDATLEALMEAPAHDHQTDIDDLVTQDPTPEQLASLEKASKKG